jgi:hypothetical protein
MASDFTKLSTYKRTTGGGFGKGQRFEQVGESASPGPIYLVKDLMETEKKVGPMYYPAFDPKNMPTDTKQLITQINPAKSRTAWMIGTTKNDMAYYRAIASDQGPAAYAPRIDSVKESAPRNVFSKNKRFGLVAAIGMKAASLPTGGPGPAYNPSVCLMDLRGNRPPKHSFGGAGCADRDGFVFGQVKHDMLYTAIPATSEGSVQVSPATYVVNHAPTLPAMPRQLWSQADRFKTIKKIFISKKHNAVEVGAHSPGPTYNPKNHCISTDATGKWAQVQPGKWCP